MRAPAGLPLLTQIDESRSSRYVTHMVLTNAERQQRHRERMKQLAAMGQSMADFLRELRRTREITLERIDLFRSGKVGYFDIPTGADCSAEVIARDEAQVAQIDRLLSDYDPNDLTKEDGQGA